RLRRPRLRLVRHLERGRDRRAHRARPPPALALRSLLRLRAGRDRQPRRGLPARLRGALPLPGAPLARRARLARPLMRRPALLLGVQVAAVTASLGCLVAIAALHPRRLDLTPERRFTLSPYTREVLGRLTGDVRITLFYSSQAGALRRARSLRRASARACSRVPPRCRPTRGSWWWPGRRAISARPRWRRSPPTSRAAATPSSSATRGRRPASRRSSAASASSWRAISWWTSARGSSAPTASRRASPT